MVSYLTLILSIKIKDFFLESFEYNSKIENVKLIEPFISMQLQFNFENKLEIQIEPYLVDRKLFRNILKWLNFYSS